MTNVAQTQNFKLFLPEFDRKAWHQYANKNFQSIDAILTTYLDVGNIVGVWDNSTSYHVGERAIDPEVGQVFECAAANTSAPSPATFAEDRVANPTFWTSLAVTARGLGAWLPGTLYQPNDFVVSGAIYAVCIGTHTSGAVFATDAVYWDYLLDASTLPILPSLTGKSLYFLRVNAGETLTEWITPASVLAAIGAAALAHGHPSTDITDSSAIGRGVLTSASAAAARVILDAAALGSANTFTATNNFQGAIQKDSVSLLLGFRGYIDGLIMGNNAGDLTNDIDIAAGCAMDAALSGTIMVLPSALIKQLDAAWAVGTNAGMRATGVAIANTTYHIFLIRRPDTGVVDIAADTSATGANIAANTNAAYTQFRRIGSIIRTAGVIDGFYQIGNTFKRKTIATDRNNTAAVASALLALSVPLGIVVAPILEGYLATSAAAAANVQLFIGDALAGSANSDWTQILMGAADGSAADLSIVCNFFTNTSAQIYFAQVNTIGTPGISVLKTLGWIDLRGQDA